MRMEIPEPLRESVRRSLPEVGEIQDEELRERVIDAWALALAGTEFESLDDIPCSPVPEAEEVPGANQALHLRATARLAVAMLGTMEEMMGTLGVERDELIAGGLCHDLGKPYEYSPANRARWHKDPRVSGRPAIRHPVYGVHVALVAGLPESIAHIVGGHSAEGENITRSLANTIVHHADHAFWEILKYAGMLAEARSSLQSSDVESSRGPATSPQHPAQFPNKRIFRGSGGETGIRPANRAAESPGR